MIRLKFLLNGMILGMIVASAVLHVIVQWLDTKSEYYTNLESVTSLVPAQIAENKLESFTSGWSSYKLNEAKDLEVMLSD